MPEKLIRISLWGMPGSGKTTLGRLLARYFQVAFTDLDEYIYSQTRLYAHEWISNFGEEEFRIKESQFLEHFINNQTGSYILSVGGGTVLNQMNRELLLNRTLCIYLSVPEDILWNRISSQNIHRPLINNKREKLSELLESRKPFYTQAHLIFENQNHPIEEAVQNLVQLIESKKN
jgi:shikimate kinase